MAAWESAPVEGVQPAKQPAWMAAPVDTPAATAPGPSTTDKVLSGVGNLVAGAARGAGSIGATLLAPVDAAARAVGVQNDFVGRTDRRQAIDDALTSAFGADPSSLAYKTGKFGAEVAGTAGAGGAVANTVRALPAMTALLRGAQVASPVAQAVAKAEPLLGAVQSGGMSAGGVGGAAGIGLRAAGGAVNGAAAAGLVDPSDAAAGGAVGAVIPGAAQLAGLGGETLASLAQGGAKRLMLSAIKPTIRDLGSGNAEAAAQTMLDYGISPNKGGVAKLRDLIDQKNTQIADAIAGSDATIDKGQVLGALADVRTRFGNQVDPLPDLSSIQSVGEGFAAHPIYGGDTIPVQAAQDLKQGTYRVLKGKYGEQGSASTEAQKALARGLKDQIAEAVPEVAPLNAEDGRLLAALPIAEHRALVEMRKNPVGLAGLAKNPVAFAAMMADRSSTFKALVARLVNSTAPAGQGLGQGAIGVANLPLLRNVGVVGAGEASP